MQAARDRQKSYANLKRKQMEFQVGNRVMLKVSPWKGVMRFDKRGKLNPSHVGPFKVLEKKCYSDEPLAVPLEGLHIGDKLQFMEEPVEIIEREIKQLKRSRILLIKVFDGDTYLPSLVYLLFTEDYLLSNSPGLIIPRDPICGVTDWYQSQGYREPDPIMSSSSTVTYTSVYTDSEPGRVFWRADEELSDGGSPRVIVCGYDGLPMQPVAPTSQDYVPGPEHPPSPVKDPEEDPEEDHADYPTDEGDVDDEPSNDDDDDTNDEDEEPFEDEDDDKEEEEEHLAQADSLMYLLLTLFP
ncbi:hypothetical protein Tco_0612534 [Tanacetum coccineum]